MNADRDIPSRPACAIIACLSSGGSFTGTTSIAMSGLLIFPQDIFCLPHGLDQAHPVLRVQFRGPVHGYPDSLRAHHDENLRAYGDPDLDARVPAADLPGPERAGIRHVRDVNPGRRPASSHLPGLIPSEHAHAF